MFIASRSDSGRKLIAKLSTNCYVTCKQRTCNGSPIISSLLHKNLDNGTIDNGSISCDASSKRAKENVTPLNTSNVEATQVVPGSIVGWWLLIKNHHPYNLPTTWAYCTWNEFSFFLNLCNVDAIKSASSSELCGSSNICSSSLISSTIKQEHNQ